NHFAGPESIQFTTAPYDTSGVQTAPLLIGLHLGMPCALSGGDFLSGGDTAGNCVGVDSAKPWYTKFSVFQLPANEVIHVAFSKPVSANTIVMAKQCITSPAAGATGQATIAVEKLDADGACAGIVRGNVILQHRTSATTRSFQFVPDENFMLGKRYLVVICGSAGTHCAHSI